MRRDSHLRFALLILALISIQGRSSMAADIETLSGLYFRLPFAADGSGPERPHFGLGFGPTALPRAGLSLEMNAEGLTRLGVAGYNWHWQVPAPEEWGADLLLFDDGGEEELNRPPSTAHRALPKN